jgi:hypothetical protein
MQQQDTQFDEILNKFQQAHQTQYDSDIINKLYLRFPPSIPKFPHLFHINKKSKTK